MHKIAKLIAAIVTTLFICALGAFCLYDLYLRNEVKKEALQAENFGLTLFYSDLLVGSPHKPFSFRLYDKNTNLRASANFKFNNMGFFSKFDYSINPLDDKEIRIVVIGGEQTASSVADISWPDFLQEILNQQFKGKGYHFKVFNIASPDSGPSHYQDFWHEFGKKFKPHLVIVNFVETDFYRGFEGAPPQYKGQRIQNNFIKYKIGPTAADEARVGTARIGDLVVTSFKDPNAIPSRPFGFFSDRSLMDDTQKVRKLQQTIMNDFIEGGMPPFGYLAWLKLTKQTEQYNYISDIPARRNFDPQPSNPIDMGNAVKYVGKHFRHLFEQHNNVVFVHSRNLPEIMQKTKFDFTAKLKTLDPQLPIVDAIDYLPKDPKNEELNTWYLDLMQEKWTNKGHQIYAEAMAKLVLERIKDKP